MADHHKRLYEQKPEYYYDGNNPYLLKRIKPDASCVLDVGCAKGNLGSEIRARGITVYGIELFPEAAREAEKKLDHVLCGDIETIELPYEQGFFDHIIFGDVLEHLIDPWAVLRKVKPFLKENGSIISCIPNIAHISILHDLLLGKWTYMEWGLLDQTHLRFFTLTEIYNMFQITGYYITDLERIVYPNPPMDPLIHWLDYIRSSLLKDNPSFAVEANAFQYVIEATINRV
jgi:2-polyprenyl-3-methyl-5-hydroxy-6-metoxy-1,4-benzoquinol methylase